MLTTPPENIMVPLFGLANFSCITSGSPQPDIQWYKDGRPLSGQTSPVLMIREVTLSDRGFYHCSATNTEGTVTSAQAVLNIQGIYQFTVPVRIPIATPGGPFEVGAIPSNEVVGNITDLVDDLNDAVSGSGVGTDPMFIVYSVVSMSNVTTISYSK